MNKERLLKVRDAILAHSARVNMDYFLVEDQDLYFWNPKQACGTVGCIAGWAAMIGTNTTDEEINERKFQLKEGKSVVDYAREYLGLTHAQAVDLFWRYECIHESLPKDAKGNICPQWRPGTELYAQAVAERIDNFISAIEQQEAKDEQ